MLYERSFIRYRNNWTFFNKDKIIEIACIEIDDHIPTGEKFHVFLNPEMEISQGAYETHGITREFLNDKPEFKRHCKRISRIH